MKLTALLVAMCISTAAWADGFSFSFSYGGGAVVVPPPVVVGEPVVVDPPVVYMPPPVVYYGGWYGYGYPVYRYPVVRSYAFPHRPLGYAFPHHVVRPAPRFSYHTRFYSHGRIYAAPRPSPHFGGPRGHR